MNCLADVSQRLQNALDSNYNVIDMPTVLEVITVLEGTTITKEQLETTRLAKYINQLRRKTSNDQLARRSKNLLKKWREMVIPNQNTVQPQSTANAPLSHPSSAISPRSVSNQASNRLAGNTSLSNGGTPTAQHLSTWSPLSQNVKGAVLSKENMIRRPMPTTPQSSVQHKSSSMPMTSTTTPKFPPPILNTNNGSNSSLVTSHASPANPAAINSTKVTSRLSSAQPISFANLISQAEVNQHIDGPKKVNPNTNSSNRNINTIDISNLSQSPKMPKIPRKNNVSGATAENHRSASPQFLMGNRTSNFRLPPHNDVDDANSRPSFTNIEHQTKLEQPNNNSRKTFNGFGNMFLSNAKPSVPITSSDIHDSHSGSSSMILAPVSQASLSIAATTVPASSIEITDSQKHKKRKREEKSKERNSNRRKDATSLGTASFDNSISNSSSLGMFNSATNTTNTTNLGSIVPSTHKLSELTFTGKFSKSDDAIINIDTTSGSSSPKQMIGGRTDSLMQESPCDSPMLSVENSNESEIGDSILKSSNLLATTAAPTTAVPLDTLDSSRLESSNMPTPKKRGRKKGSTGVDRNMSLAGPSSSQPIFGSVSVLKSKMDSMRSVKKVKTTKELLAELQNRKPPLTGNGSGSTNSSPMLELPIQSLVSPSSLCSDNSQTNSTDMRSTTATPVSLQTAPTPEPHTDSLPNNDQPKKQTADSKTIDQQKGIDDEIMELRRQLPPVDFDAVNNWSDHDADVACTCKLIELDQPLPNADMNSFDETTAMEGGEKVLQIEVKLTKIDEQLPKVPPDLADATQIGKSIKPPIQVQLQQKPPRIKSIFDLDFDDDDDPIHRFTTNTDDIKVEPVESAAKLSDPNNSNSMPSSLKETEECNAEKSTTNALSVPCLPPPPIPVNEPTICQRFEVVEDALCPAKAHFITSKNCVTRYHVDTLHNCFIPNVNGNWSVIESDGIKSESTDSKEFEELKFVPKYDHMRLDKIPKNMRDFDMGWYRQRKLRKKVVKTEAVDIQPPDCGNVDQDETEVISSRLSNSSQTNVIDVTHSDGRDELNCDLKTSCMDDGNVEDVSRVNELEAMDGQSEECVASTDSRKRKASKRKSVKYKIRKSSSDFSRDLDGAGGPYDGIGDGSDPKIEAPTRIILKFSRQVTTDADVEDGEDDDDDDDYDESDEDEDDGEETFDECEEEDEIMDDVEDGSFVHDKDDLLEYNDQSNCHSNDNIREINIVENNNDDNEKFVRNVDLSADVMDVDHFKLRRFDADDHECRPPSIKFDDHLSSSSHRTSPPLPLPVSQLPAHSELELNHTDSNRMDVVTTPQSMDCDDNEDDDDDKTGEQLPLDNNEQLASFNNVSNENESGIRPTLSQEFKEWHEVVRVRSYNDELLTILPYVVID
ncbi:mediator of RNA polymerase II transcription subunit 26 [Bradysia coprophila]|uniref:mediator of RNA polymerase II transcription subunit 26 n=1 Tax=Bradysia coprophila TaxID=38358 RepID=UPI00187D7948|nr:mediator of RNA polymerase II transcription subunit 26 [Bradysia coprophila]